MHNDMRLLYYFYENENKKLIEVKLETST